MVEVKGEQGYPAHLARWRMPAGSRSFCPQPIFCATRGHSRKPCLSAAFRRSRHSGDLEAGALISYGFDLMGLLYDIASYVQRLAGVPSHRHHLVGPSNEHI